MRTPDFDDLLSVLACRPPSRPTLFEFFLNEPLYLRLAGPEVAAMTDTLSEHRVRMVAYRNAGFDYVTLRGSEFAFPKDPKGTGVSSISLNAGVMITGRAGMERYPWPDPDAADYSHLDALAAELPAGMKIIVWGPGGVLENVIDLVGYDQLCLLTVDDPALVQALFDRVGSALVRYYEICGTYDTVGAMISNDDWGFKTQTVLSPEEMRRYVFPWHTRIVEAIHGTGRPAILHSCGNLELVMDDIIDDMGYDAKHSFEDTILPVEEAYERWGSRIAILGGIDVDFVIRSPVGEIKKRARAMLERTRERGGFALGTGNSVPEYVPQEKYLALISVATER